MKFLTAIRASSLLGKGNKLLQAGSYEQALERALKARNLDLPEHYLWLCRMIEGKARFHLGDRERAREPLQQAQAILTRKLEQQSQSVPLQNIVRDIDSMLGQLDSGDS